MTSNLAEKTPNKHILYVWQGSYPWEIRVDKITKSLIKAGYKVSILCRQKLNDIHPDIELFSLGSGPWTAPIPNSPVWTHKIKEIIQNRNVDLVIARDILIAPSCIKAAHAMNKPCVIDMAEHYPAAMRGWKKYNSNPLSRLAVHNLRIPDRVEQYSALHSEGIITVCEEQEIRLNKMGVAKENLCSVQNTPELDFFLPIKTTASKKAKKFAHHGYLTPERGLDQMIKAFAIIKDKKLDLEFHIHGVGECEDDLKKLSADLKAPVHFHGYYKIAHMPHLISEIDVGVLPYLETEFLNHTIANKLFDYMAFSRPVLVSKTAPFVRIIKETGAGDVLNISQPEKLAEDIIRLSQRDISDLGVKARKAVEEKYNWSQDEKTLFNFISRFFR